MSYHDNTFRLLGLTPRLSSSALRRLEDAEKRLGQTLPMSVRDWYQYDGALRILAEYSNDDPPIDVTRWAALPYQDKALLPIRHENQGVCTWAVELNGSDNPQVYVDVDTDSAAWIPTGVSFSDYVYACVWDHTSVLKQPALVQAQCAALSSSLRAALAKVLTAGPTTQGWPGSKQYRFAGDDFSVLIWDGERQADWFVGAVDAICLKRGLAVIASIHGGRPNFYGCSDEGNKGLAADPVPPKLAKSPPTSHS